MTTQSYSVMYVLDLASLWLILKYAVALSKQFVKTSLFYYVQAMLICFCTVWRSYIHSNTWIFSLSDGVADILAICMDAWVLGAVAKGRYSLN